MLPFTDHYGHPKRIEKWLENITIPIEGKFADIVQRFCDVWFEQLKRRAKVRKNMVASLKI